MHEMHRPPTETQCLHEADRIFPVNRHRRGLRRNIRLPSAERYANIGKGECGRVVDAVADHHHRPALLQLIHIA